MFVERIVKTKSVKIKTEQISYNVSIEKSLLRPLGLPPGPSTADARSARDGIPVIQPHHPPCALFICLCSSQALFSSD